MNRQHVFIASAGASLVLLAVLVSSRAGEPSSTTGSSGAMIEQVEQVGQVEPMLRGGSGRHVGGITPRHVDPATPGYEGVEHDGWDELDPKRRVDRVEQALMGYREQIDAAASTEEREQLQIRALLLLSAARAEYFADEAGRERYLELEAALEQES